MKGRNRIHSFNYLVCQEWKLLLLLLTIFAQDAYCENNCFQYTKHVSDHQPTESYQNPNPLGKWVSFRCEITTGVKYIVRRIDIQSTHWFGYFYHYKDSSCRQPTFTVKVKGAYEVLPGTATPSSKASYSARFDFDEISIRMLDGDTLEYVLNFIISKCPSALPDIFRKRENETIDTDDYLDVDIKLEELVLQKKHCRYFFSLHPTAYKKIRMVKSRENSVGIKYDILYFGDIPPVQQKSQKFFVALEFQYGLSRHNRPDCEVCKYIGDDVNESPLLPEFKYKKLLKGDWITDTCTAQNDKDFVSKYYHFSGIYPGKKYGEFTIYQSYFKDSDCRKRLFDMKTGGTYGKLVPDPQIKDVTDVQLSLTWLTMTGYDEGTLKVMKEGEDCGVPEFWRFGVEQNLTSTNGCKELSIYIPLTLDLKTRIYTTKHDVEFYINDDSPDKYFTSNLISCKAIPINITKITTARPKTEAKFENTDDTNNIINQQIENVLKKERNKRNSANSLKYSLVNLFILIYIFLWLY